MRETGKDRKENRKRKKKNKRNPQIMGIMYFFIFIFAGMLLYINYFVYNNREEMINNAYNPRQELLAEQNIRGTIYAKDKSVLAETKMSKNGTEERVYPYENLFAHAVGYASNGKLGIESAANYYLITSDIPVEEKLKNEIAGKKNQADSIVTTLDVDLQQAAYDALGVYKGAILVTEPATGKILAMVSKPDFDPNEIGAIWDDIIKDDSSTVLLNRTTQGLYPPGSTFKILTTLAYIREKPDEFLQYQYQCNGKFKLDGNTIQCYHGSVHGQLDLKESFAKSCNSSFANIGTSLDYGAFQKTLSQMLFEKELPVDFAYKKSKSAISAESSKADMMQLSIGQGATQMTPLHVSMITSAIANGGLLMKPYMIDRVLDESEQIVKQYHPAEYGAIMTKEEADILKDFMVEVVENGTGTKLSGLSYTAAGKTGSAEFNKVKEDSHAWFTGFAPVENPRIVVTVILEGAGSGGDYAVPIAKRVMDAYLK